MIQYSYFDINSSFIKTATCSGTATATGSSSASNDYLHQISFNLGKHVFKQLFTEVFNSTNLCTSFRSTIVINIIDEKDITTYNDVININIYELRLSQIVPTIVNSKIVTTESQLEKQSETQFYTCEISIIIPEIETQITPEIETQIIASLTRTIDTLLPAITSYLDVANPWHLYTIS